MRLRVPELFVNYVWEPSRDSPINVAVARVILGSYLIWNFASVDFAALAGWHVYLARRGSYMVFNSPSIQRLLPVEQVVLLCLLFAFVLGYRERLTALLSALLVSHLAIVLSTYSYTGRVNSMFIAAYVLIFFGLYAETDPLSLDTVRGAGPLDREELDRRLRSSLDGTHSVRILQLALLAVAILYFGSAWAKLVLGPGGIAWEWMSAGNLARWTISSLTYWEPLTRLGELMLQYPVSLSAAAVGTVVLEAGLLVVALLGLPITPVVLGLLGMHTVITLALGPFFFDQYVFLALFVPWDVLYRRVAPTRGTVVVYDGTRSAAIRSLYPFELLDANGVVQFRSQANAREHRREDGHDAYGSDVHLFADDAYESDVHLFADGVEYAGYFAFRELLRRFPPFGPVAWLMDREPVEAVGTRLYGRIAGERGRCFVRPVEDGTGQATDRT